MITLNIFKINPNNLYYLEPYLFKSYIQKIAKVITIRH